MDIIADSLLLRKPDTEPETVPQLSGLGAQSYFSHGGVSLVPL